MRPQTLPDFTDDHLTVRPIARATTLPAAWYRDPAMEALDLEVLFHQQWIYVCAAAQAPQSGQTQPFNIGGAPMLLSRDSDGKLRALHAVCRHRGGPLALVGGDSPLLQCGYHGWTYKLSAIGSGVPSSNRRAADTSASDAGSWATRLLPAEQHPQCPPVCDAP